MIIWPRAHSTRLLKIDSKGETRNLDLWCLSILPNNILFGYTFLKIRSWFYGYWGEGGGDWYLIFNFETPCMLLLLMMVSRDPRNNYRLVNRVNMIMMVKEKWQPAKKMCDLWINTCVLPTGTPSTSPVFYSR